MPIVGKVVGGLAAAAVCLGFTGVEVAWADLAHDLGIGEDAQQPTVEETMADSMVGRGPSNSGPGESADLISAIDAVQIYDSEYRDSIERNTTASTRDIGRPKPPLPSFGPSARLGTSVGYVYNNPLDVLALGGTVAAGYRFDRLIVEAEYGYYRFQSHGAFPLDLGHGHRLGVLARVDLLRTASGTLGKNSRLALYGEGGVARQANQWSQPASGEAAREVPTNTTHTETTVGIGLRVDHGLARPIGFPSRIGWLIGWRMVAAPHDRVPMVSCRGTVSCEQLQMPTEPHSSSTIYGTALLFTTGLEATW